MLHLERAAEENAKGVHSVVYQVSSSDIDLVSRAAPPDGMLDVVFNSNNEVLFETGRYYWPAGDVTVDVDIDLASPLGTWDANGFSVTWHVDIYEGDAIVVDNLSSDGIDNDFDDQIDEADEEDEDTIDPLANLVCEERVQLTGSRAVGLHQEKAPMLYRGGLELESDGILVSIEVLVDPSRLLVRLLQPGTDASRPVGEYSVQLDGTFEGRFLSGTVMGRITGDRVLAEVGTPSGGANHYTTLEAIRVGLY